MVNSAQDVLELAAFYAYGYGGRVMYAVRAPFTAPDAGEGLIGRIARIDGGLFRIVSVLRQIGGPVAAGEPIGVEISPVAHADAAALKAAGGAPSTARPQVADDRDDVVDRRRE